MQLLIGSDDAGLDMEESLKAFVEGMGHEVTDFSDHEKAPCLYRGLH